ncbi:hydrogen peroxide-inducible genes activator [Roseovarius sp. SYSU LYC5161]|jgi:LysR family hydrogen peroxide-inducible transcriptional activator|uniref:hydrogen peroxide-inducible genes activator n=1 Tax=Roseovarius halophilus (ex Wu et al. 2025) TaxID=3376060 RepID=UPI002870DCEE|nr:LysR substrate-binding domain-containing protein [Roseovarius sp.]
MVTLRQLRFLVALVDEGHFSRAAEVCHVSQPTLSSGLKELEDMLGVQLAERTKRSVLITPIGEEIARRARGMLTAAVDIEQLASESRTPYAGDIRLGAIPTIAPYLMPKALPAIHRAFPDLRVFLREELTESLLEGLATGRLDAALIAKPFEIGSLETVDLFEDGYLLAAPPGYAKTPVTEMTGADLEGSRLMLLEKGHCLQRHALSAFPDRDIQQDDSFSATSLPTLISMVAEGLGITLLPRLAVEAGIAAQHDVDLFPLLDACPRQVVLAWRPTSARAEFFNRLGDLLGESRTLLHLPRDTKAS